MQSKKIQGSCKLCSKEFHAYNTSHGPQKYCSRACSFSAQVGRRSSLPTKKKTFLCDNCSKYFVRQLVKTRPQRFCSRDCFLKSNYNRERSRIQMVARGLVCDKNPNWKGRGVSYKGVHRYIETNYGKASDFICSMCLGASGSKTKNWSNIDHKYTRDRDKWAVLCKKCHSRYDQDKFGTYSVLKPRKKHMDKFESKSAEFSYRLANFELDLNLGKQLFFTKVGDGELLCIDGATGANCDGQEYSEDLGNKLLRAYRWLALVGVYLGKQTNPQWMQPDIEAKVFSPIDRPINFIDGDIFLHRVGEMVDERRRFYKAIKLSDRHKIFVGPKKLEGVVNLLNVNDFIEVKPSNAFDDYDFIFSQICDIIKPNSIILFSSGLMSKVLMHKIMEKGFEENKMDFTCLDIGSAFDNLFIGQTRTEQVPQNEMQEYYKELL